MVIDCITLWCTNFFFDRAANEWEQPSVEDALQAMKEEFDRFTSVDATFIFVTNEIGSGDHVTQDARTNYGEVDDERAMIRRS